MTGHSLALQLDYAARALSINLEGISEEASCVRPAGGGNSINWVLGHIASYRQLMLEKLGTTSVWPAQRTECYARGTSGEVPDALRISTAASLDAIRAAGEILKPLLQALSPEAMAGPSSNPRQTFGEQLSFLLFHESYHVGQIGLLRRLTGKPGAIR